MLILSMKELEHTNVRNKKKEKKRQKIVGAMPLLMKNTHA